MSVRSNSFGDTEFYQAKKQIKQRFTKILFDLQETVKRNGYAVETVQRFRKCLNNPENSDVSRLPFYSAMPLSRKQNKITCVLSMISFIIQRYWEFCAGDQEAKQIIVAGLGDLESYAAKRLKAFKINKNIAGYWLGEIK